MKPCELCKSPATVYCDSDEACLCWTCDAKVHSANFLVARHSRSLLCRVCRSPTPWNASGEKLPPSAASICEKCVGDGVSDAGGESEREYVDDDDEDDDEDEYEGDEDCETEIDDNQVVPLCYTPPPASSSSGSDDESVGDRVNYSGGLCKRKRENAVDLSEDDVDCSSVQKRRREDFGTGTTFYRFLPEKLNGARDNISGEKKTGAVTGVLDLNESVC